MATEDETRSNGTLWTTAVAELHTYDFPSVMSDFSTANLATTPVEHALPEMDYEFCKSYAFAISCVVLFIFFVVGTTGNSLAIYTLWPEKTHNTTSFILICLAIIDNGVISLMLLMQGSPTFCGYYNTGETYMREVFPYLSAFLWTVVSVLQMMSALTVVLVMLYRYWAVCRPQLMRHMTFRQCRLQMIAIVVFTLVYYIPRFSAFVVVDKNGRKVRDTRDFAKTDGYLWAYDLVSYYLIIYAIPFPSLIWMSVCLTKALRASLKKRGQMTQHNINENEITRTLLIVVITYMVCQVFNPVRRVLHDFTPEKEHHCGYPYFYYRHISTALVAFNSTVNFFIYFIGGKRFRKLFHNRVLDKIVKFLNRAKCCRRITGASHVQPFLHAAVTPTNGSQLAPSGSATGIARTDKTQSSFMEKQL